MTWACPECGRRVPSSVPTCRCGAAAVPAVTPPPANANTSAALKTIASVVGTIGAVIGVIALNNARQTTKPAAAPVAVAPRPTAAPPSTPVAPATATETETATAPAPATETATATATATTPAPLAAPAAPTPALEDLVSSLTPAVVIVEVAQARGTGFFVAPDTLLTNGHVVGANATVTLR